MDRWDIMGQGVEEPEAPAPVPTSAPVPVPAPAQTVMPTVDMMITYIETCGIIRMLVDEIWSRYGDFNRMELPHQNSFLVRDVCSCHHTIVDYRYAIISDVERALSTMRSLFENRLSTSISNTMFYMNYHNYNVALWSQIEEKLRVKITHYNWYAEERIKEHNMYGTKAAVLISLPFLISMNVFALLKETYNNNKPIFKENSNIINLIEFGARSILQFLAIPIYAVLYTPIKKWRECIPPKFSYEDKIKLKQKAEWICLRLSFLQMILTTFLFLRLSDSCERLPYFNLIRIQAELYLDIAIGSAIILSLICCLKAHENNASGQIILS